MKNREFALPNRTIVIRASKSGGFRENREGWQPWFQGKVTESFKVGPFFETQCRWPKEMDAICCNGDFVYGPTVLQSQLKSNPAKSGSSRILGVGYPNPVSGRKSIPAHP